MFLILLKNFVLFLLAAYRTIGTTHMGGCCRYYPSCSEYAVQCTHTHNPLVAIYLIFSRVLRCRPGTAGGYDPVPLVFHFKRSLNANK